MLLFWVVKAARPQRTRTQLWGPFLPFVLATVATVPYLLQITDVISRETALHWVFALFMLYPLTEKASWAHTLFGYFHWNVLLLALAYTNLVGHYIRFIKKLR